MKRIGSRSMFCSAILLVAAATSCPASAQEAPMLFGNYSANVDGAVDLRRAGIPPTRLTRESAHGITTKSLDGVRAMGNYSANVDAADIRGR